jgi:long-chain acyl-CoA synthetase
MFSVNVAEAQEGVRPIHRSTLSPEKLIKKPAENVETLFDVFAHASNKFKDHRGFGYRTLQGTIKTTKQVTKIVDGQETTVEKVWTYFQLSDYNYYTYREAFDVVKTIGFGLAHLGYMKNDKLQVAASTRYITN